MRVFLVSGRCGYDDLDGDYISRELAEERVKNIFGQWEVEARVYTSRELAEKRVKQIFGQWEIEAHGLGAFISEIELDKPFQD